MRRGEQGQTATEYAGVLALIAVIFLALGGIGIGGKVSSAVSDAICVITNCDGGAASPTTTTAQTPGTPPPLGTAPFSDGNALDYALEDAGRDAGEAWKERDLDRVVAILEPLEGHLPRHQQSWLDYARRNRESA
jgi:Flp pilus assembly pilin Flp